MKFSCSYRDTQGKGHTFTIEADDWPQAESHMQRIRGNATLDGEQILEASYPGIMDRLLSTLT